MVYSVGGLGLPLCAYIRVIGTLNCSAEVKVMCILGITRRRRGRGRGKDKRKKKDEREKKSRGLSISEGAGRRITVGSFD